MIVLIRKSVLLSLILYALTISVRAQDDPYRAEIGFQTGLNLYSGDVNTVADLSSYSKNLTNIKPDIGFLFRYRFNRRFAARIGYDYTAVKGTYSFTDQTSTHRVALNNPLHVFELCGEFNFFDLENNPYKRFSKRFSPFIFAGVGGVLMPDYQRTESNSNYTSTIPFGVGVKWKIAERWNFNVLFTNRLLLGDHLEGLSEFDNPAPKTTANPMNHDLLSGVSVGLSIDFWARDCDCPGGTFNKGRKPASQKAVKQKRVKKRDK